MEAPTPPQNPSPYTTAAAQFDMNIETNVAKMWMDNADEDRPDGTVEWVQNGSATVVVTERNPTTGAVIGTTTKTVPRMKKVVRMTAVGQAVYDKQMDIANSFNSWTIDQLAQVRASQSTTFNLTGLPARSSTPSAPTLSSTAPSRPAILRNVGATDLLHDKRDVQAAIFDRLQYQIGLTRDAKVEALANQGIFAGTLAYERAMYEFDKQSNDAMLQAYLHAGTEQTRLFNIELQKGQFALHAQNQEVTQSFLSLEFVNKAEMQKYEALAMIASYVNETRESAIRERMMERSVPINEISTLLHGGQVRIPESQRFQPGGMQSVPLGDYVYRSAALAQQDYQFQVQQQNQMIGGMMGMAANIGMAPMTGGGSMFGNFMGKFM